MKDICCGRSVTIVKKVRAIVHVATDEHPMSIDKFHFRASQKNAVYISCSFCRRETDTIESCSRRFCIMFKLPVTLYQKT
jgi:hypothetical protein